MQDQNSFRSLPSPAAHYQTIGEEEFINILGVNIVFFHKKQKKIAQTISEKDSVVLICSIQSKLIVSMPAVLMWQALDWIAYYVAWP